MEIFDIFELEEGIEFMDIGAAAIAETPIYRRPMELSLGHLNAFDGDERQIEKLKDTYGPNVSIFNDFLFDGKPQSVYLCAPESGMTSLLKPKESALRFFNGFEHIGSVQSIERVETKRLDDIDGLPDIDFLKMDTQGAELTILHHGTRKLRSCISMQVEVAYLCLYENQPTFGDIDLWMRETGLVPHCFLDVKRWSITPTIFDNNFRTPGNQLLESDIVYIKDPLKINEWTDLEIKKMSVLAHYCFKSFDLCAFCLIELERRQLLPEESFKKYLSTCKTFI